MAEVAWRQIHWPRPLDPDAAMGLVRTWASDQLSPQILLETRSSGSTGLSYWLGAQPQVIDSLVAMLGHFITGTLVSIRPASDRQPVSTARQMLANTRHRAVETSTPDLAARAVLSALARVRQGELLVLQVMLGPRRIPLAVPQASPSSVVAPWWKIAWRGDGQRIDAEKRAALRDKVSVHGFACAVRLGVVANTPRRRQLLVLGLTAALRSTEPAGLHLRLGRQRAEAVERGTPPWRWRLRLNAHEVTTLVAWPLGDSDLPGLPSAQPKPLPPALSVTKGKRVLAVATAPGSTGNLTLGADQARRHLHVLGPSGSGKSVLLAHLINQDIRAGRAVVVVEPKGDLVAEILAHVPAERESDVVILDAADSAPVGLNPLITAGRKPEVVVDGLMSVFKAVYGDTLGPRSGDILHAGLLTLARREDASLVMLPLLLTNPGFRRSLTRDINDPIGLGPFWAWYESLPDGGAAVSAPLMNKLRQWLLRPSLRGVLGQRHPKFSMQQVFTERKILLVPLQEGLIGPEVASLLGSLVVAQLWQATQARVAIPVARRHPVMVTIDEVQNYLHLSTDLGEALAQARGLGVGFTLAHQFLGQLPRELRDSLLGNVGSRVCFRLGHDDALSMSRGHPELSPEDLTALGPYEVYAGLVGTDGPAPYASGKTVAPAKATTNVERLRRLSRERYGESLQQVEASFLELIEGPATTASTGRRRRST